MKDIESYIQMGEPAGGRLFPYIHMNCQMGGRHCRHPADSVIYIHKG